MSDSVAGLGRRHAVAASIGIFLLFLALRLVLAFARAPFFDELFTVWIARKPVDALLRALQLDSGPPLYYLIVHALFGLVDPAVDAARAVSLAFASAAVISLLAARHLGSMRLAAALLLSVLPVHLYFSTEARGYAACGAFAGLGALALERWFTEGRMRTLSAAVAALALAAYCHYYGVLLFVLPFVVGLLRSRSCHPGRSERIPAAGEGPAAGGRRPRDDEGEDRVEGTSTLSRALRAASRDEGRRSIVAGLMASIACGVLFLPGFHLASLQPAAAATRWMVPAGREAALGDLLGALDQLNFAGRFPETFLARSPRPLQLLSLAVVGLVLLWKTAGSSRAIVFASITLTPLAVVGLFLLAGRRVYFPFRFEVVLAVPFVVWLAAALERFGTRTRAALLAVMIVLGLVNGGAAVFDHAGRGPSPYHAAAAFVRVRADPAMPVVASGFAWLELVHEIGESRVIAFPSEQGQHPGWRATPPLKQLRVEARELPPQFVWVGEIASPELSALRETRRLRLLVRVGAIGVIRAE